MKKPKPLGPTFADLTDQQKKILQKREPEVYEMLKNDKSVWIHKFPNWLKIEV